MLPKKRFRIETSDREEKPNPDQEEPDGEKPRPDQEEPHREDPDRQKRVCENPGSDREEKPEPDRQKLGSSLKEPGSDFEEPKGLLDLPDEVLLKILRHLPPSTIHHRVALVIKFIFLELN